MFLIHFHKQVKLLFIYVARICNSVFNGKAYLLFGNASKEKRLVFFLSCRIQFNLHSGRTQRYIHNTHAPSNDDKLSSAFRFFVSVLVVIVGFVYLLLFVATVVIKYVNTENI